MISPLAIAALACIVLGVVLCLYGGIATQRAATSKSAEYTGVFSLMLGLACLLAGAVTGIIIAFPLPAS